MKNNTIIILAIILLANFVTGCKKSNDATSKDYTLSVKDKTWWGAFTYTGKDAEYYSVHFNTGNTFIWSQFSGDYKGQWAISGKELTMIFDAGMSEIKANISDEDKLVNITEKSGSYAINTCQLIANPNIPLDNTEWKGQMVSGTPYLLDIGFRAPLKADIRLGVTYTNNIYTRSTSGAVIRTDIKPTGSGASTHFFGVIISGSEMVGSDKNSSNQWKASKQ